MLSRRGFLGAILAAGTAPAFVRFGSLMVPRAIEAPAWSASAEHLRMELAAAPVNASFDAYVGGLLRQMARSLGTPYEELARSPAKMQYAALQARLDGGW